MAENTMVDWQSIIRKSGFIQGSTKGDPYPTGLTMGGRYFATNPTLTDGQYSALNLDASGRVKCILDGVTINLGGDLQVDVSAFQNQAGDQKDAKVNGADILVVQTGTGTDASAMTSQIATYAAQTDKSQYTRITDGTQDGDIIVNSAAGDSTTKLGVASEVVDFDTSAGTDFTGAMGILGASATGAKPILVDSEGSIVNAKSFTLNDGRANNGAFYSTPTGAVTHAPLVILPLKYNGSTWDRDVSAQSLPNATGGAGVTLKSYGIGLGQSVSLMMGYDNTTDNNAYRAIKVDNQGRVVLSIPTTITGGTKTVTTAGVAEALGASTTIKSIYIRATSTNTGNIYVGGSDVSSANGIALAANDSVEIDIADLATVYIDSDVNGEGVGFTYFN